MKHEPKIGERVAWDNVRYRCYEDNCNTCIGCDLWGVNEACRIVECRPNCRQDGKSVFFLREGHYSRKELIKFLKRRRGIWAM